MYNMLYIWVMTNIISISDARNKLPALVNKVSEGLEKFLITVNNKPKAVILSVEEAESLEETAEILSIPGALASIRRGQKDIKAGRSVSFEEIKKKYEL